MYGKAYGRKCGMEEKLRDSGIEIIGNVPWGTYFCQFYQTKDDLIEILVPYFKAGLENSEFCMWIISAPLTVEEAKQALRKAVPGFEEYLKKGQIEILPYTWYVKGGTFDSNSVLSGLTEKLNKALEAGYEGLRVSGNTSWLEKKNWENFVEYEEKIDEIISNSRMMALCTYPLEQFSALEIVEVVANHQFALIRKKEKWERIESFGQKKVQNALKASNKELKVQSEGLEAQFREINKVNRAFHESEDRFRRVTENSPDIIVRFDRQMRHIFANPAAAEPYGKPPEEIIGKTNAELGMDPKDVKFWEEHYERIFATGSTEIMEFHYFSPQGKEYYFDTRIVPEFIYGEIDSILAISRDITAAKKAEAKLKETLDNLENLIKERTEELEKAYISLKESETGLSEAQRMAHLGNWDWNIITNELHWSDEIYRIFKRQPQEFNATYSAFLSYVHPKDRPYLDTAVKEAFSGKPYSIDHRILLPDGEERIVHEQGEVIFEGNGNQKTPARMRGTIQDITELKKAEEKNQILANAVESSDDAIVTKSLDGNIISWSRGAEQVYGYLAEEILGKNVSILEPDSLKGEIKKLDEKIKNGGKVRHYETLRLRKDGRIINASITLSPVLDAFGRLTAISTVTRDITESKKAQEALRLSSIYNRSLIEASLDPLVTIGPDGEITDLNIATELVTGYSRDELIGTDFTNYFTDPEKAREGYEQVFREGLVWDYELEIQNKNGETTPVLYNASVYKDETGRVIGIFAAARDITERKNAEKLLKQKLEELARSNAELEQFAYVASHDLQEPLRMIASYLQLLQRKYEGKLDEKADKYIHFAVDGASRMQSLINDLLDFSRVTTKAKEFEPTNCEEILDNVLSGLEVVIKESGATVSHDSLPEIIAESTQIAQVFQNLISNAIKFRSEKSPEIRISAKRENDYWLFSVKDNGIGIDPKYWDRIFEVFKRLHKREEYPGTGIGLSICKKIVERHGGSIWIDSEQGKGSTFYFTLPINPEAPKKIGF